MQTDTSRPVAINLKKLIAAEMFILGFCLWLACVLHTHANIPLLYQGTVKTVTALLLIATCPLVPVPVIRWKAIRQFLISGLMTLIATFATLVVVMATFEIESVRDRFAVAVLSAAVGLITTGYFKRRQST